MEANSSIRKDSKEMLSEREAHEGYRKKPLLVLGYDGVGAGVVALRKNVLVVCYVLKVERKLQGALFIFFSISYPEIGAKIGILFFAEGLVILEDCSAIFLRGFHINRGQVLATNSRYLKV